MKQYISPRREWLTHDRVRAYALIAATVAGVVVCYRLARPFLPALAWSLALAIVGAPAHRWIEARLRRPNLAASVSVLALALVVILPLAFVAQRLVAEAAKGAASITLSVQSGAWRRTLDGHPAFAPLSAWLERQIDLPGTMGILTGWLTSASTMLVQGSITQLFGVLLTFYLLFYFLRDRRAAMGFIRELSPLSPAEMDRLFTRIVDTVNATIYGTVAVAVVQGVLGGLMFWWLDLPGPLIWGVVMALLAVVPVLGAFVIWIPAALVLALDGRWAHALLLVFWGAVVVGGIDNLLYPMLVGSRSKLHTVPALIAIIGGVALFGASGLIVGPIVMAVTVSLIDIWRTRLSEWDDART